MKCGFCGYEFNSEEAETACQNCPLVKGCRLVRCPQCGYEMPPEPKLISWLRNKGHAFGLQKSKEIDQ